MPVWGIMGVLGTAHSLVESAVPMHLFLCIVYGRKKRDSLIVCTKNKRRKELHFQRITSFSVSRSRTLAIFLLFG